MLHQLKKQPTKEILLRQPSLLLELCRYWDDEGHARHSFVMHPAVAGKPCVNEDAGDILMDAEGHEVSRRDVHHAFYLFQRFHLSNAGERRQANA